MRCGSSIYGIHKAAACVVVSAHMVKQVGTQDIPNLVPVAVCESYISHAAILPLTSEVSREPSKAFNRWYNTAKFISSDALHIYSGR